MTQNSSSDLNAEQKIELIRSSLERLRETGAPICINGDLNKLASDVRKVKIFNSAERREKCLKGLPFVVQDDPTENDWTELVQDFSQFNDRLLFNGDFIRFLSPATVDMVSDLDEERDRILQCNALSESINLIMDATSIRDLAKKIAATVKIKEQCDPDENPKVKKIAEEAQRQGDLESFIPILKNKIPHLKNFFGVEVKKGDKLTSSQLALLHILFMVENSEETRHKGLLAKLLESSFLQFYPADTNYHKHIIFIKSCFLQKMEFIEAYRIEYIKGLIYYGVNTIENFLYKSAEEYIINQLGSGEKLRTNTLRRNLINAICCQLEKKNTQKIVKNSPISQELSADEKEFIEAYFYFIKLGIHSTIDEPIIPTYDAETHYCNIWAKMKLNNQYNELVIADATVKNITQLFEKHKQKNVLMALGELTGFFSDLSIVTKKLPQIKEFIKNHSKKIAEVLVDGESRTDNWGRNIKNHCDCCINLCDFVLRNGLVEINCLNDFINYIYLFEKCCADEVSLPIAGFRGGKARRRSIAMKTVLLYFNDNMNSKLSFDNIDSMEFSDVFFGIIAFCNTLNAINRMEGRSIIESRQTLRRLLYVYFSEAIPLLKQKDYPFKSFTNYAEDIFPPELIHQFCLQEIKNLKNQK
ncbi:hypothetical protein SDC9_20879 [bioreactor metagenome]|uniref:Uncharacterized protein n=1 Tax=bioreactor metagenome TaxID=1076179 RepID=A0A644U7Z3_9ZZZZ